MRFLIAALFILAISSTSAKADCNLIAHGATGSNKTLDTAAFNTCLTELSTKGGVIYLDSVGSSNCFLFGPIDGQVISNITIKGAGAASCYKISGVDSSGNWMDLSGSNDWTFEDVLGLPDGTTIPAVAILWACTGVSCGTSGVLKGLTFNRAPLKVATTKAGLYAYGFGSVEAAGLHGSLAIENTTWTQTNNGPSNSTRSKRNAMVHLTATNDMAITSAYRTITTDPAYAWGATFTNFYIFDHPPGFVAPNDNNTTLVLHNISNFLMNGGALICACNTDAVISSNGQGFQFNQVQFLGVGSSFPNYYVFIGEGLNTFITFNTPFFSSANIATFLLGPPVGGMGGVWYLNITGTNVAGFPGSEGFIYSPSCTGFAGSSNWILNSYIQMYAGGSGPGVWTCGSIDSHTIFQGAVTVVLQGAGAVDNSHKF